MKTIKVIEVRWPLTFEETINEHLKLGWHVQNISSSSVSVFKGGINGNHSDFYEVYKHFTAILIKEK